MDQNEVIAIIKKYILLLKPHFELEKVYLFGSYARKSSHQDSDIDVAVVVKNIEGDYFNYTPLMWKLRRQVDERIEPVLFIGTNDSSGFLSNIMQNGIEVQI